MADARNSDHVDPPTGHTGEASSNDPVVPRRALFRLGATGAFGLAAISQAAHSGDALDCDPHPTQTPGPFWVDGMLNRWDIRSDTKTGDVEPGLPLQMSFNISEATGGACSPLGGGDIWVDVWHCNAIGEYSDVSQQGTEGLDFLRGYQLADAHGNVRFLSVYPGWYPGRTIHIHFRVRRFVDGVQDFNFVSQVYFDQAVTEAVHDEIEPYKSRGQPNQSNEGDFGYDPLLMMRSHYNPDRVMATFNVVVNANPGMAAAGATPLDHHAQEHMFDFGGGSPTYLADRRLGPGGSGGLA